jgi:hypothetical protein
MECKFLNHGMALAYQDVVKPCCEWQFDQNYKQEHQTQKINFTTWHQHPNLLEARKLLAQNIWPTNCKICKNTEEQGRADSTRLSGNNAYKNFEDSDITLEIRPGSVCNFACQTCWPAASRPGSHIFNRFITSNLK